MLLNKTIISPYQPVVKSENDTSNFKHFTATDEYLVPIINENEDPFLKW